jgi:hypothetical protein
MSFPNNIIIKIHFINLFCQSLFIYPFYMTKPPQRILRNIVVTSFIITHFSLITSILTLSLNLTPITLFNARISRKFYYTCMRLCQRRLIKSCSEELDGAWSLRLAIGKLSNVGQSLDRWPKIYYLDLLRDSEGTLSRCSRLYSQSLALTNPYWARVVGYGPFSLCVIH